MEDIRDARRLYDIYSIMGWHTRKRVFVCPLPFHAHANNTPSFSVFNGAKGQLWQCHGNCGKGGDVIDLIGYMKIPGYDPHNGDHIKRALQILHSGYQIAPVEPAKINKMGLPNNLWETFMLTPKVINYLISRGITEETARHFRLGQYDTNGHEWLAIPHFERERLMAVKLRNLNSVGHKDRFSQIPGGTGGLFNVNEVNSTNDPVLIVKSEIPTMLLWQLGFKVCAPTLGENSWRHTEAWSLPLSFSRKRILIADNDPDPKVREKIMEWTQLRADTLHAELHMPPDAYKDVDEWVLAEMFTAVPIIQEWMR
jgi:hypothetical protein